MKNLIPRYRGKYSLSTITVLGQCSIRAITKLNLRDTGMVVDHTYKAKVIE